MTITIIMIVIIPGRPVISVFRDAAFEDVMLDNSRFQTPHR